MQADRFLEFQSPGGRHYNTRIPRYGRDLVYDRRSTEALVPSVGVNEDGSGEVFRLNLEVGRFMKAYEVDVGGDDAGNLQGGINAGSVNTGAIAEHSHNLLAFGTSLGTVEFWDSRSRGRVGILGAPPDVSPLDSRAEITALQFHRSGLEIATGSSTGMVHLYDLRSPVPLLKKDQGYGFAIKNLTYLTPSSATRAQTSDPKIMSADKRIIKIWDQRTGDPWTSVEPAVDLNHVEWVPDSGMFLTANEGRQQHSFFVPQLGPAPKWCAFLDNLVEEMAEDPNDPNSFTTQKAGEVYDNFKFLTLSQLRTLSMDHLVGKTSLLRPYMHGYFVSQQLYEEARLISNPELFQEQRAKTIQEKINKERESRIRGSKKVAVKVNRRLAEKLMEKEAAAEKRRAKKLLEKGEDTEMADDEVADTTSVPAEGEAASTKAANALSDPRFARLFQDEDFEVDEASHEFQSINPSTKTQKPRGLTAVEREELDSGRGSSSDESDSDDDATAPNNQQDASNDKNRISTSSYRKQKFKSRRDNKPQMTVSNSAARKPAQRREKSFADRMSTMGGRKSGGTIRSGTVVGEREITFAPASKQKKKLELDEASRKDDRRNSHAKDRRSASGNVFRRM